MKDIEILIEPDEIHGYMYNLWRTDLFRQSHDSGGIVHKAVDNFSRLPRFFYWASDPAESPHFSAWWGGIQKRDYGPNEAVHDLYYLHEIWHAGTMPYRQGLEFKNFERKIVDNELGASTISEMAIYFEMPELRKLSFQHPIFVDSFLFPNGFQNAPDRAALKRWQENRDLTFEEMRIARRDVMMAAAPNSDDEVEFWIQKFSHQNAIWAHQWFARYDMVEQAMIRLRNECETPGRSPAMDRFMQWLQGPEVTKGTPVPFPDEARAFAASYELTKGLYKETFERVRNGTHLETYSATKPGTPEPS